jgi:hypothetical protein
MRIIQRNALNSVAKAVIPGIRICNANAPAGWALPLEVSNYKESGWDTLGMGYPPEDTQRLLDSPPEVVEEDWRVRKAVASAAGVRRVPRRLSIYYIYLRLGSRDRPFNNTPTSFCIPKPN